MLKIKPLTGQTATPALRVGDQTVWGSSQIVARVEQLCPHPALLPADPALAAEAREIEAMFDDEFGPQLRRAALSVIIDDTSYLAGVFGDGCRPVTKFAYRATLPLVRPMIAKGNGLDRPGAVEEGWATTGAALDYVADKSRSSGFLVGDEFSLADLTAAAMLAPAVEPPNSPMTRPRPHPEKLTKWLDHWRVHPGAAWVRKIYRDHRKANADFDGEATYD